MHPTVPYVGGPFQPQLTYWRDDINTLKPFLFPLLEKRVSIQASFSSASEFALADGRILDYPFMLEISRDRMTVERRLLPLERATRFEVALLDDKMGGVWYLPEELGIQINTDDRQKWTSETIGRCVSRRGVQEILEQLLHIEQHFQLRVQDKEKMLARKKSLACADLPSGILESIGRRMDREQMDDRLSMLSVYIRFYK